MDNVNKEDHPKGNENTTVLKNDENELKGKAPVKENLPIEQESPDNPLATNAPAKFDENKPKDTKETKSKDKKGTALLNRGENTNSDNAVTPTPRSTEDFIVRPPLYIKGVPVADNLKNRLLMREIDRQARLEEKIAKTHPVEKFFPYFPPPWGLNRLELATDKVAHSKEHQRELHEWHNVQIKHQRQLNERYKQENGHRLKVSKRVQRAPPSPDVTRWKDKTHVRRWAPKKKHVREFKDENFKR